MKILALCVRSIYLWAIGVAVGAILACDVLSAPVILNAYQYLPSLGITSYDSGILLGKVYVRFNYMFNGLAILILIYELLMFNLSLKKSLFSLGMGILSVILIFLFTLYYTPAITNIQQEGAAFTGTEEFENISTQSEIVLNILFVTLSILFISRMMSTESLPITKTTRQRKK